MSFGSKGGKCMHFPRYYADFRFFHLECSSKSIGIALAWALSSRTGVLAHFTVFFENKVLMKISFLYNHLSNLKNSKKNMAKFGCINEFK